MMNRNSRISLIVLLTSILVLTIALPGLANAKTESTCFARVVTIDKGGNYHVKIRVTGDLVYAAWEGDILVNRCEGTEGTIPYDTPLNNGQRYASFGEACDFIGQFGVCIANDQYSMTLDDADTEVNIYDPESKRQYWATDVTFVARADGSFTFEKWYDPNAVD
jgi:hypothetical protein